MDERTPPPSTGIPAGVRITGEVVAAEDLDIQGQVDGQITAPEHRLTVGPTGLVAAKIIARVVTLAGAVEGTVTASERVRILESARVAGHLHTPALTLADGALFNGTVDPARTEAAMLVARYRQKQQE
jgi:cytoskeletal protein CcmA (bactofilin family)